MILYPQHFPPVRGDDDSLTTYSLRLAGEYAVGVAVSVFCWPAAAAFPPTQRPLPGTSTVLEDLPFYSTSFVLLHTIYGTSRNFFFFLKGQNRLK